MSFFGKLLGKNDDKAAITSLLPEDIYAEGVLELKDIIAPSALKIGPKEINLGEKIARTFFVISYPRYLTDSWFAPIINGRLILNATSHC